MMIQKATLHDLDALTELFDLYRLFYQQKSDLEGARGFMKERLTNDESMVFIAYDNQNPVGFVQLYPSFSSVSMKRSWLLNDLYVKEEVRGQGVGGILLKKAIHFAESTGAKGVLLETAEDNKKAQRLYEKAGFKKESSYFYYFSI
jgi:ribosomal protein S18 acetylase RimI-like enzyme